MGLILEAEKPLSGFLGFCAEHKRLPQPNDEVEGFEYGAELAVRGWQVKYIAGFLEMDAEAAAIYVKEYKKQFEVNKSLNKNGPQDSGRGRAVKNIIDYKQRQLIYKGYSFYLTNQRLPEKTQKIIKYFGSYDSFVKAVLERIHADKPGVKIKSVR